MPKTDAVQTTPSSSREHTRNARLDSSGFLRRPWSSGLTAAKLQLLLQRAAREVGLNPATPWRSLKPMFRFNMLPAHQDGFSALWSTDNSGVSSLPVTLLFSPHKKLLIRNSHPPYFSTTQFLFCYSSTSFCSMMF